MLLLDLLVPPPDLEPRSRRLDLELLPEVGEAVGDGVLLLDLPEVEPDLEPRSRRRDLELLADALELLADAIVGE